MEQRRTLDRRDFLRLGLGAAAAAGLSTTGVRPAAAAPGGRHIPVSALGIQLYTVRDLMASSVEGTLGLLADIGYREVEFAGLFGADPHDVRSLLRDLGLTSPASHIGVGAIRDDLEDVLETAKTLGQRWVVLPYFRADDIDAYRQVAQDLNEAGAIARTHGIRMAYHNHAHEFAPIDGVVPYDVLLAETDPKLVDMELDLYWVVVAGVDPVTLFHDSPKRFPLVHVKDRAPDGSFADVGEGTIDFARILAHREVGGIRHYLVERDDLPHPEQTARTGHEYLRRLTFPARPRAG